MTDFPLPTIHLNGSSGVALASGYHAALKATNKAIAAMAECGFHMRDYYVQPPGNYGKACDERDKHLMALNELRAYLLAHLEHLSK